DLLLQLSLLNPVHLQCACGITTATRINGGDRVAVHAEDDDRRPCHARQCSRSEPMLRICEGAVFIEARRLVVLAPDASALTPRQFQSPSWIEIPVMGIVLKKQERCDSGRDIECRRSILAGCSPREDVGDDPTISRRSVRCYRRDLRPDIISPALFRGLLHFSLTHTYAPLLEADS